MYFWLRANKPAPLRMKPTELSEQQLREAVDALVERFSDTDENNYSLTDIYVHANSDTGQIVLRDDDDTEIFSNIVDAWVSYGGDDFYSMVADAWKQVLQSEGERLGGLSLVKPFTILLVDEEGEHVADLFNADDDNIILSEGELLKGLDDELDDFINKLLGE